MSDEKISAMPAAAALTGAELVPLVQGGANVKATAQNLANLAPTQTVIITKGSTATSGFAVGDLLTSAAGPVVSSIPDVAIHQLLSSGGVGAAATWTGAPIVTSIQFGTGTPLNDYEEGTWTPLDFSGAALSFTNRRCTYTKTGRVVFVDFNFSYPANASGLDNAIGGLPFSQAFQDTGLGLCTTNLGNAVTAFGNASITVLKFQLVQVASSNANLTSSVIIGQGQYPTT